MGAVILERFPRKAAALAGLGLALSLGCGADEAGFSLGESLARGRFALELRPRYNRIDESDKPERTEGVTTRVIAGWRSAPWYGLRLTVELINTGHLGKRNYNDDGAQFFTSPYPLLPDPGTTDWNQVFLDYTGLEATRIRVGRQVVRLNNQRWVSDNDFRQIPQLFEGVSASYSGIANTELSASYFRRMRNTSGTGAALELTILNAAYNPAPGQEVGAYGVFHEQAQNGAFTGFADSSYRVIGVRAAGSAGPWGGIEVPYIADFAQQKAFRGGDARIDARYWRLGAGLAWRDYTLRYDQEVKGSNGGQYGAQMPLTDFYAFNGWTLHFFNTPSVGLVDRWVTLRAAFGRRIVIYGEEHRFRSDYGSIGLGRETDVGITFTYPENCSLRLQHARYNPGPGTPDPSIRKTWLTLTYTF